MGGQYEIRTKNYGVAKVLFDLEEEVMCFYKKIVNCFRIGLILTSSRIKLFTL